MPVNQDLLRRRSLSPFANPFEGMTLEQPPLEAPAPGVPNVQPDVQPMGPLPMLAPSDAEQRYLELARKPPNREDFAHPGKLARLAAILTGAGASLQGQPGGPMLTRQMLDQPYEQATQDWERQLKSVAPLAEMEMGRSRLQQQQYSTDVSRLNAELDYAAASAGVEARKGYYKDIADHWTRLDENSRVRAQSTMTFEQRQQLQGALQDQRDRLGKELEQIRQTGMGARQGEALKTSRENVATQQAGATARNQARISAPARVSERQQLEVDILRENVTAEKLLRKNPEWKEFVTVNEKDGSLVIRLAGDIPANKRDSYKRFISTLAGEMERSKGESSITYEELDNEEELDEEEEEQ